MTALQKPTAHARLIDRIEKSLQSQLMRALEIEDKEKREAAKFEALRLYRRFQEDTKQTLAREGIR